MKSLLMDPTCRRAAVMIRSARPELGMATAGSALARSVHLPAWRTRAPCLAAAGPTAAAAGRTRVAWGRGECRCRPLRPLGRDNGRQAAAEAASGGVEARPAPRV